MDGRSISQENPYELTRHQHVHAERCWKEFRNSAGQIECLHKATGRKTVVVDRNAPELIAMRAWDQNAESDLMGEIEKSFFGQLNRALHGQKIQFPLAVSEYYFLWCYRLLAKCYPIPDQELRGVTPLHPGITQLQAESLEKRGYAVIRNGNSMPGHHTAGMLLRLNIDREIEKRPNMNWSVITALEGEFLIPDGYPPPQDQGGPIFFPISPTAVLVNHWKRGTLTADAVADLNRMSYDAAREHVFARDFKNCPIAPRDRTEAAYTHHQG